MISLLETSILQTCIKFTLAHCSFMLIQTTSSTGNTGSESDNTVNLKKKKKNTRCLLLDD